MNPSHQRRIESPPRKAGSNPDTSYSILLPFLAVLLTLVLSTCKDLLVLDRHKIALMIENTQAASPLDEAARQAAFIDSLHTDLAKLALTDPVAARVLADFFSPPAARQDNGASAPGSSPR